MNSQHGVNSNPPTPPNQSNYSNDLKEKLAAIEHERWADWQKWMHGLMGTMGDTKYVLDAEYIKRWNKQIATPYAELSDREKASDMEQVDRYWPLIEEYIESERSRLIDELEAKVDGLKREKYSVIDRMTGKPEPSPFYRGANMEVDYINEAIDQVKAILEDYR